MIQISDFIKLFFILCIKFFIISYYILSKKDKKDDENWRFFPANSTN